ncbi:MAG TPA: GNAT family N-acetyltransferase [Firmicutes bacterium]|nr:GNAT family N-acetyltransferase [Candidatus Fermentithermobacillaceae bacterium]
MSFCRERSGAKLRVLEGEKVRLRPVEDDDIPKLVEWENDADIVRWAGKQFDTVEDAREWHLKPTLQHRTFAIELLDGRLIGEIEVLNITWKTGTAEIRVFIGEKDLWNRGLGEDAVSTLVKAYFASTSLKEIFLRVDEENRRARRCYQKVGFRTEGRVTCRWEDGSRRTILLMKLRKTDGSRKHAGKQYGGG